MKLTQISMKIEKAHKIAPTAPGSKRSRRKKKMHLHLSPAFSYIMK
jgi:hypothetical protein